MKRAILCAATLLLVNGAWGQEKRVTLKAGDCATIHLTQHEDLTICAEKLPAKQEKKAPKHLSLPAFDVPPKESDAWEPPLENNWQELLGNGASSPCPEPFDFPYGAAEYVCVNGVVHYKVHHRTCADPKRVLLMSEDKVLHCYLFKEKP